MQAWEIRPGDLIRVDVEPEPGGTQLQQVCRVTERTIPQTGPIKLRVEIENSIAPVIYTPPSDLPDTPQSTAVPAIEHLRLFELPAPLADGSLQVGVLAERPHGMVTGLNVHYDSETTGSFEALGVQEDFALRAVPTDAWDDTANGPFPLEVLSTRDLDLLDDDPGPTAARDNRLLLLCFEKAPDGSIAENAKGFAKMEIISIESFALTGLNQYEVGGFRGRFGTTRRAFDPATAELWIIPRFGVTGFDHRDFSALQSLGQTGYFRLQPFTAFKQRELSDCADLSFKFPTVLAYAPQVAFTTPATDNLFFADPPGEVTFAGVVEDADGNLSNFSLLRRSAAGSEETLLSVPLSPTGSYAFEHVATFTESGVFTVVSRAQDASGRVSDAEVSVEVAAAAGSVATPVISPNGGFISFTASVTLTCSTPDATIEFSFGTLGISTPPSTWHTYAGSFEVPANTRLWARATASGLTPSSLAKADFYQEDFGDDPIIP